MYGMIYKIKNHLNNRIYIGATTQRINVRWSEHIRNCKCMCSPLYDDMMITSLEYFTIDKLCEVKSKEEMYYLEEYCIRIYKSTIDYGNYNVNYGTKHSLITKQRMSISFNHNIKRGKKLLIINVTDTEINHTFKIHGIRLAMKITGVHNKIIKKCSDYGCLHKNYKFSIDKS